MPQTALIAGATGLVGSHCLRRLLSDSRYSQVIALVRKPSGLRDDRYAERVVNFDTMRLDGLPPGADVYCALGTTIRTAGSQEAFRKVDFGYVVNVAKESLRQSARQFTVVSSVGANPTSSNFYLKTKGEMEQAISELPFHAVHICRPSLLLGQRHEVRTGERLGIAAAGALQFALVGSLRKYRAIQSETVAEAMVAAARANQPGVHVYHYDEMQRLAKGNQNPSQT
jgi:uncharacterized protein YbjT (DUF2867 family)